MAINPYVAPADNKELDPGKGVSEMATEQANKLVETISSKALVELTDMRDHIDSLMRALKLRNDKLVSDIGDHAALATEVIDMKSIVRDSLEQLLQRMQPVPKVVTAARPRVGEMD